MPCTTILAGKKATADGSTLIARNEDLGHSFNPKRFIVVKPEDQPTNYQSVNSKCKVALPEHPLRYTATPELAVNLPKTGWWGEAGINGANVAMSATETSTTNSRILGIDPMVKNGIGEEDFVTIVLPYIKSARAGVKLLGSYLEKYGTYESNGVAFSDQNEVWYFESIGGHHLLAIQ
jgi:dipeptidase